MIYLRTGLPGASKTLNSVRELVLSWDESRPFFYTNIKLLMLDMLVANSFSGWFYGWYFPRLEDKKQRAKLIKIMSPVHDNDEFITLNDVPWLKAQYESHNHFETWLFWVRKVYPKNKLTKLENMLSCIDEEERHSCDLWEMVKPLNLHFTRFDDPQYWFDLPKKSVILIDECQEFFPPRPVGSKKPQAIAALETHRHGGYDLHFITQDATLADQNLRKLVGRHVHFFNPFGGKRITRFESPQTFDPNNYHARKQATKKFTAHATNFYGVYWSAEIHTHKFKFPKVLLIALLTLGMLFGGIGYVYFGVLQAKQAQAQQAGEPVANAANSSVVVDSKTSNPPKKNATGSNSSSGDFEKSMGDHLEEMTKDVYISGANGVWNNGTLIEYQYSFFRTSDSSIFEPKLAGLKVQHVGECLALLSIAGVQRPITCNPYYKRETVVDEDKKSFRIGKR